jgi:hypothetical protein
MDSEQEQKKQSEQNKNIFIGFVVFVVLMYLLYAAMTSQTIVWSEWVLQGNAPTCGTGNNVYKRQCTVNSVVQATVDACVNAFGDSDTKTEIYNLTNKCSVTGRNIILERNTASGQFDSDGNELNIAEIKVYDPEGVNLIVRGVTKATSGSLYAPYYGAGNLLDGELNNFAHTFGGHDEKKQWFNIDLGSDKVIGRVEIYNRKYCCQERVIGARIRITDSTGQTVFTSPDISYHQAVNSTHPIVFNMA